MGPSEQVESGRARRKYVMETEEDEELGQRRSWLVPLLLASHSTLFALVMFLNNCPKHYHQRCFLRFLGRFSFQPLSHNPSLGPSSLTLERLGGLECDRVVDENEGWRLVTSIWLHAGLVHLASNMITLYLIGIRLEKQFGFVRIGVIYILAGFGGSMLSSLLISNNQVIVGASGAVFGLLGAMLSEIITNWTINTNKGVALVTLVIMAAVNFGIGGFPHVGYYSQIGGFLVGFLLGFVLLMQPQIGWLEQQHLATSLRHSPKHKLYQQVLWILSLALLIIGYVVALVMLFR